MPNYIKSIIINIKINLFYYKLKLDIYYSYCYCYKYLYIINEILLFEIIKNIKNN